MPRRWSGRVVAAIAAVIVLAVATTVVVVTGESDEPPAVTAAPTPPPTTTAPPPTTAPPKLSAGAETSAATLLGWPAPKRVDEFDGPLSSAWEVYDGDGHNGNGRRSPAAITTAGGILTITGDAAGRTGGMAWGPGQKYGRWEGRVRAPAADPSYHAVLLLWPDAENWPVGGEVDFMEMVDPARQSTKAYLHWGRSNNQVTAEVNVDATQWHNWAVEWTPDHIVAYLDGTEWFRSDSTRQLPPGKMHLAIQLDWFPEDGSATPTTMQVDWVKEYPL
ncbi:glycoside hydrolase family 16 protein [Pseudonocardia sp. GCM10023141]|uniref:glycoside hydrolase family 16 protein n=1 Tax=Pseudonocardia sp. GCM10023141 TaxID=3252653 RepID=UPI00361B44AE